MISPNCFGIVNASRAIRLRGPAVIMSASGMAENGRILHYLRNNVEDERNTILIVGVTAQHTLARRLVERRLRVKIWWIERNLNGSVEVLAAFSAHADRNDLSNHIELCGTSVKIFFLVHGESEQQEALRKETIARSLSVDVPTRCDVINLN